MHLRSALPLCAAACLFACAEPPSTLVVVIAPGPRDGYAAGAPPRDAFDATAAAAQLPVSPEGMVSVYAFLTKAHERIHAEWVGDSLPRFEHKSGAASDKDWTTTIEFAVSPSEGQICDVGIARSSGDALFDVAAVTATVRASPVGAPPAEAVGANDEARLTWRFHRRGEDPCAVDQAAVLRPDGR